jgi:alanine dehydrogenase
MTELERKVCNNTNMVVVSVVIDLSMDATDVIKDVTEAVSKTDHTYFARRFEHYCNGGLVSSGEREAFAKAIARASLSSVVDLAASTRASSLSMVDLAASLL